MSVPDFFVYGVPSEYGGAGTELLHQLLLWRRMGLTVGLIPSVDDGRASRILERLRGVGVIVSGVDEFSVIRNSQVIISFCNKKYLQLLPVIAQFTKNIVFVNCMTWLFARERERMAQGLIRCFLYQNPDVLNQHRHSLRQLNRSPQVLFETFCSYFESCEFPRIAARCEGPVVLGRISRADPQKFNACTGAVFSAIGACGVKEVLILGFDDRCRTKAGQLPNWVRTFHNHHALPVKQFFDRCHIIVQPMDTVENWPRVGLEAMASGTLLIVDDRGGWRRLIQHGKTGFLCGSPSEFVHYARAAIENPGMREAMVQSAYKRLEEVAGYSAAATSWWNIFEKFGMTRLSAGPRVAASQTLDVSFAGRWKGSQALERRWETLHRSAPGATRVALAGPNDRHESSSV